MNDYRIGVYIPCPNCKSAIYEGEPCKKCAKLERIRLLSKLRKQKSVKIHEFKEA